MFASRPAHSAFSTVDVKEMNQIYFIRLTIKSNYVGIFPVAANENQNMLVMEVVRVVYI